MIQVIRVTNVYPSEICVVGGDQVVNVGDIILAINGRQVTNYQESIQQIHRICETREIVRVLLIFLML